MKTSIRIITIFIVLTVIASDLASGQNRVSSQTSVINEQPVSQTQQPGTTTGTSRTSQGAARSSSEPSYYNGGLSEAEAYEEALSLEQAIVQANPQMNLYDTLQDLSRIGSKIGTSRDSKSILVIPTGQIEIEELLTINEDMNVMSRIFANELGRQRTVSSNPEWSFTDSQWVPNYESILGRRTGNTVSSIYLQGYGALFMMEVDFPLSGPPETQENQEETEKEDVDEVWEQTRQQIYQPQVRATTSTGRRAAERPEVKYDAQQVENLKTTLIQSLKHATNIRILKPDESVILSIRGMGIFSGEGDIISMAAIPGTDQIMVTLESRGERIMKVYKGDISEAFDISSPTLLVIRAKKSDIDAFVKGDMDIDQFREKVQVLSYPLLGGNIGATSAIRSPRSTGRTSTFTTP